MLVELRDGGITNMETDTDYTSGCETCDWGAAYVNEYSIFMTNGTIDIEVNSDGYDYVFSEGLMMKIFLQNIDEIKTKTEDEFADWLEDKIASEIKATKNEESFVDIELTYDYKKK